VARIASYPVLAVPLVVSKAVFAAIAAVSAVVVVVTAVVAVVNAVYIVAFSTVCSSTAFWSLTMTAF